MGKMPMKIENMRPNSILNDNFSDEWSVCLHEHIEYNLIRNKSITSPMYVIHESVSTGQKKEEWKRQQK